MMIICHLRIVLSNLYRMIGISVAENCGKVSFYNTGR